MCAVLKCSTQISPKIIIRLGSEVLRNFLRRWAYALEVDLRLNECSIPWGGGPVMMAGKRSAQDLSAVN